ncbi:hypothetical protein GCM10011428_80130 [Streptomyces violaceus]
MVGRGEFGVGQDRDGAETGGGEEGRHPGERVGQRQQHTVPGAHPVLGEHGGRTGREVVHLPVGPGPVPLVKGGPPAPPAPLGELRELGRHVPGRLGLGRVQLDLKTGHRLASPAAPARSPGGA